MASNFLRNEFLLHNINPYKTKTKNESPYKEKDNITSKGNKTRVIFSNLSQPNQTGKKYIEQTLITKQPHNFVTIKSQTRSQSLASLPTHTK